MGISVSNPTHYVYLKTNAFDGANGNQVDTIPLKVTSIQVQIQRTVPSMSVPLSSIVRGESETIAIDLGMASKEITIDGFITSGSIKRSHTKDASSNFIQIDMTAQEMAQLIASGVDSSGLAKYQNFNELVFLIKSNIDKDYVERGSVINIPFTFASRGTSLEKDNTRVPLPSSFPTSETSTGLSGFIQNFSFTINVEEPETIGFNLSFKVARIFP